MKRPYFLFIILCVFLLNACKKDQGSSPEDSFVRTAEDDSDVMALGFVEAVDGSILCLGRDKQFRVPGHVKKIDREGNLKFAKRLPEVNKYMHGFLDIPGNGFITYGHNNYFQMKLTVCTYDDDANLLSTATFSAPDFMGNYSLFRILRLQNGNYAFAAGNTVQVNGALLITDNSFNLLYTKIFNAPSGYYSFVYLDLCEMPDNTIAIAGYGTRNLSALDYNSNTFILRTDFTGAPQSFTFMEDSVYSETPGRILNLGSNIYTITGRSLGWNQGNGVFVDYESSQSGARISGMISINKMDSTGTLISRSSVAGYPNNGLIHSVRKTMEGGYILCGTVNQANDINLVSKTKIFLVKLDTDARLQWTKILDTVQPSFGVDAIQSTDGGYLVTGHIFNHNRNYNILFIKTDENGNY